MSGLFWSTRFRRSSFRKAARSGSSGAYSYNQTRSSSAASTSNPPAVRRRRSIGTATGCGAFEPPTVVFYSEESTYSDGPAQAGLPDWVDHSEYVRRLGGFLDGLDPGRFQKHVEHHRRIVEECEGQLGAAQGLLAAAQIPDELPMLIAEEMPISGFRSVLVSPPGLRGRGTPTSATSQC